MFPARYDCQTLSKGDALGNIIGNGIFLYAKGISKLKRQEQVARERYYQSVFAYEETVLEALGDVEKSLLDIATYRSQAENYARLLRANIEIATMTNSLYRNGMSAYLDVIDAERNMYQSQMEYVNLVAQQYINYVNLFKALGGGW